MPDFPQRYDPNSEIAVGIHFLGQRTSLEQQIFRSSIASASDECPLWQTLYSDHLHFDLRAFILRLFMMEHDFVYRPEGGKNV